VQKIFADIESVIEALHSARKFGKCSDKNGVLKVGVWSVGILSASQAQ